MDELILVKYIKITFIKKLYKIEKPTTVWIVDNLI